MPSVDIVIPVLNEEKTLSQNVGMTQEFLRTLPAPWNEARLVIADNGSTDRTQEIARQLVATSPGIGYIRLEERGVGRALKRAWTESTADFVGYIDLDLATDLKHLPEAFTELSNGADIVYGSRLARGAKVVGRTLKREVISRVFNAILKIYVGARFSDGMCGFKFLRRAHLPALLANGAESDGWFFATELLLVGQRLGLKLHELPVHWTDDPDSRVRVGKLTAEYLKAMKKLRGRHIEPIAR
ncbi:glycosyltransferase [Roseomonas sp. KE2513]|uniref:glycosyltransferase n=1 Tax=Roseomonas sp. KE2513 TaxID=2479202 RepID=UPI0018DFC153|nr:glycosyltransferase [Roseomonas sp. KE2513]MBI0536211.1 glycosyltransferase [Roseomonas sp. KE2513]